MIQSIYTSVSNANLEKCDKRGQLIKSEPIPLLKDKYLGEYRTELERAKVRKNLGISDNQSLLWGNIDGTIEAQKDLVQYIELKWEYSSDLVENLTTVKEAIDYALYFISLYEANTEEIETINLELVTIKDSITNLETNLSDSISDNSEKIALNVLSIEAINQSISEINEAIENIDVDRNIQTWINNSLTNSKSIKILEEDNTLEVILSTLENNAIQINEEGGLYSENLKPSLEDAHTKITDLETYTSELNTSIENNTNLINDLKDNLGALTIYNTDLPDETTSALVQGTTVLKLKGMSIIKIIDTLLFPTVVRDLVYPQFYFGPIPMIVEVGSNVVIPVTEFLQGDAGSEIERTMIITYEDAIYEESTYNLLGTYNYQANISYNAGEYLIDNKGEITDKRIEAGSLTTNASVITTYPWYVGNSQGVQKLSLVAFNTLSEVREFSLTGNDAVIKLPGRNSQLLSLTVDGGLGFLNVDLSGWTESTELINGFPYKVWTKQDPYAAILPHRINFILSE